MEKLLAMFVAAQLTDAACANAGGTGLNISQDISDPNVRAKNLQVWETFRIMYAAAPRPRFLAPGGARRAAVSARAPSGLGVVTR